MRQVRLWQLRGQLKQLPEQFGVFGNLYQGHHGHCSGAHWPTTGQSAATCLACRPTRLVRDRTAGYCSRRASNGISVRQAATFVRHRFAMQNSQFPAVDLAEQANDEIVGMRLIGTQQGIAARTADRDMIEMPEKPARCMAPTIPVKSLHFVYLTYR